MNSLSPACATHGDRVSVGTCERCGRFMCEVCRAAGGKCVDCLLREQQAMPDASGRAQLAVIAMGLNIAADAASGLLSGAKLGMSADALGDENHLTLMGALEGLVGLGQVVLLIGTLIVFLRWWHLMVRHTASRGINVGATPGWAVGYWFIPFVNLARPYRIARDAAAGLGVTVPVGAWWAFWISSNIASQISTRITLTDKGTAEVGIVFDLIGSLLAIPAAWFCIKVIRGIQSGLTAPATVEAKSGAAVPSAA